MSIYPFTVSLPPQLENIAVLMTKWSILLNNIIKDSTYWRRERNRKQLTKWLSELFCYWERWYPRRRTQITKRVSKELLDFIFTHILPPLLFSTVRSWVRPRTTIPPPFTQSGTASRSVCLPNFTWYSITFKFAGRTATKKPSNRGNLAKDELMISKRNYYSSSDYFLFNNFSKTKMIGYFIRIAYSLLTWLISLPISLKDKD